MKASPSFEFGPMWSCGPSMSWMPFPMMYARCELFCGSRIRSLWYCLPASLGALQAAAAPLFARPWSRLEDFCGCGCMVLRDGFLWPASGPPAYEQPTLWVLPGWPA
eukprot:1136428-Pelagomonas_calceolata.AAC.6